MLTNRQQLCNAECCKMYPNLHCNFLDWKIQEQLNQIPTIRSNSDSWSYISFIKLKSTMYLTCKFWNCPISSMLKYFRYACSMLNTLLLYFLTSMRVCLQVLPNEIRSGKVNKSIMASDVSNGLKKCCWVMSWRRTGLFTNAQWVIESFVRHWRSKWYVFCSTGAYLNQYLLNIDEPLFTIGSSNLFVDDSKVPKHSMITIYSNRSGVGAGCP